MKPLFALCLAAILIFAGCTGNYPSGGNSAPGNPFAMPPFPGGDNSSIIPAVPSVNSSGNAPAATAGYVEYNDARAFYKFTDPNEGAFSMDVPQGWAVTNGSGLIRPYIDAALLFEAKSPQGQGFFLGSPYGYVYATPNAVLDFAGFTEGSLYPTGSYSNPMMVKKYTTASDFAMELLAKSGLAAENAVVKDRPDLLAPPNALLAQQSAAEMTFDAVKGGKGMKSTVVVATALVESSGTGVWYASIMEYYAPEELMNETELLSVAMQRSFAVDPAWAKREQQEVNKRLGIISQNQNDISEIISSTFETRSQSMDEINQKWDNYILGVEDVYDPATGEHFVVDSGSSYYWKDAQGRIIGTDIDESPLPLENLQKLDCPNC